MKSFWLILIVVSLALVGASLADVKAPALISSHMVLQRDTKIQLKGTADPGEHVRVSFRDVEAEATADSSGAWAVQMGPFDLDEPSALIIKGKNTLSFEDVVVGDVWVASGQSNMEWPLSSARDAEKEISQANYPGIRSFTVKRATSFTPLSDVSGTWEVCTPDTAGSFSAVGYFFAREVHTHTGVPIGLIHTSWGGTPIEAWTSLKAIQETPSMAPLLAAYEAALKKSAEPAAEKEEPTYTDPGNKGFEQGFAAPETSLQGWGEMTLPQPWERAGLNIDGAVWFRKDVEIPRTH
jgi:sialate O-acetylesterase